MLRVETYVVNMVQENTYLIWDDSKEACLIDPGFMIESNLQPMRQTMEKEGLNLTRCIATHRHFDHYLGAGIIAREYGVELEMPKKEMEELPTMEEQIKTLHIPVFNQLEEPKMRPLQLDESGCISFGKTTLQVFETPGHSPGHVSYYYPEGDGTLFCGDVLFKNSYGRYDLWGASYSELMSSIKDQLLLLPPTTVVYPGHGPSTTIGEERHNFGMK